MKYGKHLSMVQAVETVLSRGAAPEHSVPLPSPWLHVAMLLPLSSPNLPLMPPLHHLQHNSIIQQKQRRRHNRARRRHNDRHPGSHRILTYLNVSLHAQASTLLKPAREQDCAGGHSNLPSCALYTLTNVLTNPATLFNKLGKKILLITQT